MFDYKVDLKNKEFWEFSKAYSVPYVPRDASAPNEGFTFADDLQDDKIKTFLSEAAQAGFVNWAENYPPHATDSEWWDITVLFSDGTTKEMTMGAGNYPDTWDIMRDAFKNLTGEDILEIKMPSPR